MKKFKSEWTGKEVALNNENLTEMETAVLIASRNNEYEDCIEECSSTWTFSVQDNAEGVEKNQFRGVCSSLIQKGFIAIDVMDGDSYFCLTEAGKKLFSDYE